MDGATAPETPRTARKTVPGTHQTARKAPAGATTACEGLPKSANESTPDTPDAGSSSSEEVPIAEQLHAEAKGKGRKREFEELASVEYSSDRDEDFGNGDCAASRRDSSPTPTPTPTPGPARRKKQKTQSMAQTKHRRSAGNQKANKQNESDSASTEPNGKPVYTATDMRKNPVGTLVSRVQLSKYAREETWKISKDFEVLASPILQSGGRIKSYNLSQMNEGFIRSLCVKLRDVAYMHYTVRGWKKTVLYALAHANMADHSDTPMVKEWTELDRQLSKATFSQAKIELRSQRDAIGERLANWEPEWRNEPLYQMDIIRGLYQDPNIIIIILTSTHGELFIRTENGMEAWKAFVKWIDEGQNKKMHGYKSRPGNRGYNGFGVTECPLSEWEDPTLVARIAEMEMKFREANCVALWRTVVPFN